MALISLNYFSDCLVRNTEVKVILPNDGMGGQQMESLRTLVLLHGYTGIGGDWMWNSRILELAGKYGLCVVMPSGENSFFLDGVATGRKYATFIGEELPKYIQKTFRLSGRREDVIIGGLSMGGFGAIHTALQFPEQFGGLFALSSALLQYELPNLDKKGNSVANYEYYELMFGNPAELEHSPNNPEVLVRRIQEDGGFMPDIFMACGTEDFLREPNRRFDAFLTERGVEHVYRESPGEHNFVFWNEYLEPALRYLLKAQD